MDFLTDGFSVNLSISCTSDIQIFHVSEIDAHTAERF